MVPPSRGCHYPANLAALVAEERRSRHPEGAILGFAPVAGANRCQYARAPTHDAPAHWGPSWGPAGGPLPDCGLSVPCAPCREPCHSTSRAETGAQPWDALRLALPSGHALVQTAVTCGSAMGGETRRHAGSGRVALHPNESRDWCGRSARRALASQRCTQQQQVPRGGRLVWTTTGRPWGRAQHHRSARTSSSPLPWQLVIHAATPRVLSLIDEDGRPTLGDACFPRRRAARGPSTAVPTLVRGTVTFKNAGPCATRCGSRRRTVSSRTRAVPHPVPHRGPPFLYLCRSRSVQAATGRGRCRPVPGDRGNPSRRSAGIVHQAWSRPTTPRSSLLTTIYFPSVERCWPGAGSMTL